MSRPISIGALSNDRRVLKGMSPARQMGLFGVKPKRSLFYRSYGTQGENKKSLRRRLSAQPKKATAQTREDYENDMRKYGADILGREMRKQEASIKLKKPLNMLDANRLAKMFTPKDERNKTLLLEKLKKIRQKIETDTTGFGTMERLNITRGIDMHRAYLMRKQAANEQAQERYESFFHWLLGSEHLSTETKARLMKRGLCVHGNRDAEEVRDYLTIWINAYYMFQEEVCRLKINGPGKTLLDHVKYWHLFVENDTPEDAYTNTFLNTLDEKFLLGKNPKKPVTITGTGGAVLPNSQQGGPAIPLQKKKKKKGKEKVVILSDSDDSDDSDDDDPGTGGGGGSGSGGSGGGGGLDFNKPWGGGGSGGDGGSGGGGGGGGGKTKTFSTFAPGSGGGGNNFNNNQMQNQAQNNISNFPQQIGTDTTGAPMVAFPTTKFTVQPPLAKIKQYVTTSMGRGRPTKPTTTVAVDDVDAVAEDIHADVPEVTRMGTNINNARLATFQQQYEDVAPVPRPRQMISRGIQTPKPEDNINFETVYREKTEQLQKTYTETMGRQKYEHESKMNVLRGEKEKLEQDVAAQREKLGNYSTVIKKLLDQRVGLEKELTDAKRANNFDAAYIEQLQKRMDGLEAQNRDYIDKMGGARREIDKLQESIYNNKNQMDLENKRSIFLQSYVTAVLGHMQSDMHIDEKISKMKQLETDMFRQQEPEIFNDPGFHSAFKSITQGFYDINAATKAHYEETLTRTKELQAHKTQIATLLSRERALTERQTELATQLSQVENARDQKTLELNKLEVDIHAMNLKNIRMQGDLDIARNAKEMAEEQAKRHLKELETLALGHEKRVQELRKQYKSEKEFSESQARETIKQKEKQIASMQETFRQQTEGQEKQIAGLASELESTRSLATTAIGNLQNQIKTLTDDAQAQITKLQNQVDLTSQERDAKIQQINATTQQAKAALEAQVEQHKKDIKGAEEKSESEKQNIINLANKRIVEQKTQIESLTGEVSGLKTRLEERTQMEMQGKNMIEQLRSELTQAKQEYGTAQTQIGQLKTALAAKPQVVEKRVEVPGPTKVVKERVEVPGPVQKVLDTAAMDAWKKQRTIEFGEKKQKWLQTQRAAMQKKGEEFAANVKAQLVEKTKGEMQALETRATTAEGRVSQLEKEASEREEELKERRSEAAFEREKAKEFASELETEKIQTTKLSNMVARLQKTQSEHAQKMGEMGDLQAQLTESETQREATIRELKTMAATATERQRLLEESEARAKERGTEIENLKKEMQTYKYKITHHEKRVSEHIELMRKLKEDHANALANMSDRFTNPDEVKKLQDDLKAAHADIEQHQATNTNLGKQISDLKAEIEKSKTNLSKTEDERAELEKKVQKLEKIKRQGGVSNRLHRDISARHAKMNDIVNSVLQLRGKIKGIGEIERETPEYQTRVRAYTREKEQLFTRIDLFQKELDAAVKDGAAKVEKIGSKTAQKLFTGSPQNMKQELDMLKTTTEDLYDSINTLSQLRKSLKEPPPKIQPNKKRLRADIEIQEQINQEYDKKLAEFAEVHHVDFSPGVRGLTKTIGEIENAVAAKARVAGMQNMLDALSSVENNLGTYLKKVGLEDVRNIAKTGIELGQIGTPESKHLDEDAQIAGHDATVQKRLFETVFKIAGRIGNTHRDAFVRDAVNRKTDELAKEFEETKAESDRARKAMKARPDRFVADQIENLYFSQMDDIYRISNKFEEVRSYTGSELENLETMMKDAQDDLGLQLARISPSEINEGSAKRMAIMLMAYYNSAKAAFPTAFNDVERKKEIESKINLMQSKTVVGINTYKEIFNGIYFMLSNHGTQLRKVHQSAVDEKTAFDQAMKIKLAEVQNDIAPIILKSHNYLTKRAEIIEQKINNFENLPGSTIGQVISEAYSHLVDIQNLHNKLIRKSDFGEEEQEFLRDALSARDKFNFAIQKYSDLYEYVRGNTTQGGDESMDTLTYNERAFVEQQMMSLMMESSKANDRVNSILSLALNRFDAQSLGKQMEAEIDSAVNLQTNNTTVGEIRAMIERSQEIEDAGHELATFKAEQATKAELDPTGIDTYISAYYETAIAVDQISVAEEDYDFLTVDQLRGISFMTMAKDRLTNLRTAPYGHVNIDGLEADLAQIDSMIRHNNGYIPSKVLERELSRAFTENGATFEEITEAGDIDLQEFKLGTRRQQFLSSDVTKPVLELEDAFDDATRQVSAIQQMDEKIGEDIKLVAKNRGNDTEVNVLNDVLDAELAMSVQGKTVEKIDGARVLPDEAVGAVFHSEKNYIYARLIKSFEKSKTYEATTVAPGTPGNNLFYTELAVNSINLFNEAMKSGTGNDMGENPVGTILLAKDIAAILQRYATTLGVRSQGGTKMHHIVDGYLQSLYEKHAFVKNNPYFQYLVKMTLDMGIEVARQNRIMNDAKMIPSFTEWSKRMLSTEATEQMFTFNDVGSQIYYSAQPDESYTQFMRALRGSGASIPGLQNSPAMAAIESIKREIPANINQVIQANIIDLVSATKSGQVMNFFGQVFAKFDDSKSNMGNLQDVKMALEKYKFAFKTFLEHKGAHQIDNRSIMKLRALDASLNILQLYTIQLINKVDTDGRIKPAKTIKKKMSAKFKELGLGAPSVSKTKRVTRASEFKKTRKRRMTATGPVETGEVAPAPTVFAT